MADQLHLYVCEHFKAETLNVLSKAYFKNVKLSSFPSKCSHNYPVGKNILTPAMFSKTENDDCLVCACKCLSASDKEFLNTKDIQHIEILNCFQMFAPKEIINEILNSGAYLITPGWLTYWKHWVKKWGEKESVREMLNESITKLVLLDTGINQNSSELLTELSDYLDIPAETKVIGLDYFQNYLENKILKWKLRNKELSIGSEVGRKEDYASDYAMALDLLTNLPRTVNESVVAQRIIDILSMLFAAKKISYLSVIDSMPGKIWTSYSDINIENTKERLSNCPDSISLTNSGKGFCMSIGSNGQKLAVIEIDEITFPENMVKYQNLAFAIEGVFVLSIENSRYFQDIMEMNNTLKKLNSTKDKLFSIIAHDLRSPISSIIGFSDILIEENQLNENSKHINIIKTSSERALALLDNLLNWAKSQTEELVIKAEKTTVSNIINPVIQLLKPGANIKNISLNFFLSADIEIITDINMLKTVFRNLISNAIKFTHANGKVNVHSMVKDQNIEFTVSDNGTGMDDETLNELFNLKSNKTVNGTANEQGSGLGLVLCQDLIEKLNGKIWVESKLGKGSKFKFYLPKAQSNQSDNQK